MRRTNFCRREQTRRRRVAQTPKLSQDGFKPESDVTRDVLEEDPLGAALVDDACDIGPEVARVVCPAAFASGTEWLAGISGEDDIEGAAEDPGVETAHVIPDGCRGEIPGALGGDEDGARPILPLDKGAGVIARFGEHEAHIKASAACAEGQSVPGT